MIRVCKPMTPPAPLRERGPAATEALCVEYDRSSDGYLSGARRFAFDAHLYGHASVVAALTAAQHGKCCFCERRTLGDVEHFRPKSGWRQSPGDPLRRPGYYWLAYEWGNLFVACGPCNQRFKRELFPLADPAERAMSHHADVRRERPLLIDPGSDEPEQLIGFREEVAYPIDGSVRASATIELIALNREDLIESRRDRWGPLRILVDCRTALRRLIEAEAREGRTLPPEVIEQLNELDVVLRRACDDAAEYASMTRSLVRSSVEAV